MGCDIHVFVEVRKEGAWHPVRTETACGVCAGTGRAGCHLCDGTGREAGFNDRNYALFSMLAGVRNYHDLPYIAERRGLPADLSPELRAVANEKIEYDDAERDYGCGWLGDHSFSWLTVAEIDAWHWDVPFPIEGAEIATRRERAGRFLSVFVPALRALGAPDDVRIVFGFDS